MKRKSKGVDIGINRDTIKAGVEKIKSQTDNDARIFKHHLKGKIR